MTSTCHRVHGPMAKLIKQAETGAFPLYTMCAFEVLERCPNRAIRTKGRLRLSEMPSLPARTIIASTFPKGPSPRPSDRMVTTRSTRSSRSVARRAPGSSRPITFASSSSSEAAWFPNFQVEIRTSPTGRNTTRPIPSISPSTPAFSPARSSSRSIPRPDNDGPVDEVHVFADYLSEGLSAESNARAIRELAVQHCQGMLHYTTTDPAGNSRNAVGPTVLAEYSRSGLILDAWPLGKVADSLALLDSFISPSLGLPQLVVHSSVRLLDRGHAVLPSGETSRPVARQAR